MCLTCRRYGETQPNVSSRGKISFRCVSFNDVSVMISVIFKSAKDTLPCRFPTLNALTRAIAPQVQRFRRRSVCVSAFYKNGSARGAKRGAKRGACPITVSRSRKDGISDFAGGPSRCAAPTSSRLPGPAFRVPRAIGGCADPRAADSAP